MVEDDDGRIEALTATLLGVASGTFESRAPRTFAGDDWDVLSFLVNSTADEVEHLVQDLSREREQLESAQGRLVASERLAALGRLSAGVAHELNQPLTVITTLVDLLRSDPQSTIGDRDEDLALIQEAVAQLAQIVRAVQAFGRGGRIDKESVEASAPFLAAANLLAPRSSLERVELEIRAAAGLPIIALSPDRMRRVFINIIDNAIDALRATTGQHRRIELSVTAEDGAVVYRVADNGPGVAEDDATRVFEPFFTTKGIGEGTGLGLSVAHGIVADHGGTLHYEPRPGGGATFVVTLPAGSCR